MKRSAMKTILSQIISSFAIMVILNSSFLGALQTESISSAQNEISSHRNSPLFVGHTDDSTAAKLNWVVSLQKPDINGVLRHACGGALITNQLILTAAHCLFWPETENRIDPDKIGVKKSVNALHDRTEPARVHHVIIHPQYRNARNDKSWLDHDIAVLRLTRPIMLNEDQGVIDLPTEKASRMHPSQTDAEITGWGCANDAKMDFSPTAFRKQRTVVEVFNQTECHARWPSLEVTSKNILCTDSTAMDGKVCNLIEDSGVFFETYWSSEERQNKHRILGLFVGNSRSGEARNASLITGVAGYVTDFLQPIIHTVHADGQLESAWKFSL